ncbi:hypothetical protein, partial [Pseudomonas sp. UBA6276]
TLASDPYITGNSNGYVEVWYEATRNSQPVGSSQRLQLHVGAAAEIPWPLPKLVDATGSQVNPWSPVRPGTQFDSNTATIVVTDNRIVSGDTVGVVWALPDGTRPVVPWQNAEASGEARLPVPPQVLAQSLGQTVTLAYAVFRGPQQTVVGTSTADLQIGQLPASALSELFIVEAANGGAGPEFDVSGLTGNATVRVGRWPLIAAGQTAWLTLAGTKQDGTAYSKSLMTGGATDADWVSQGFKTFSILNDELKGLKNESPLTVTFKVSLANGDASTATGFASKIYQVKTREIKPLPAPVVLEADPASNTLNLFKRINAATITIHDDGYLVKGDQITMYWVGTPSNGSKEETKVVGDSGVPQFSVPLAIITASAERSVTVYYKVNLGGGGKVITSSTLQVFISNRPMLGTARYNPGGAGSGTVLYNFRFSTGSISVPPNLAVGADIVTSSAAYPDRQLWIDYANAGSGKLNLIGSQPEWRSNVFPTNVPGVAMKLVFNGSSNAEQAGPSDAYINGSFETSHVFQLKFVKTGPITSGTVYAGDLSTEFSGSNQYPVYTVRLLSPLSFHSDGVNADYGRSFMHQGMPLEVVPSDTQERSGNDHVVVVSDGLEAIPRR